MLREGMAQAARVFHAAGAASIQTLHTTPLSVGDAGGSSAGHHPDIDALCEVEFEGIEGVICGRAIYSGDLDFAAAQTRADALRESDDA